MAAGKTAFIKKGEKKMFQKIKSAICEMHRDYLSNELQDANEKVTSFAKNLYAKKQENRELRFKNTELENEILELKSQVKKLENSDECRKELKETISDLESKLASRLSDLEELQEKFDDLKEDANDEQDRLNEQIADLNRQLDDEKARTNRVQEAADYYKKLAEGYQSMPDMKKIVENIAEFKVPDLREFLNTVDKISEFTTAMKEGIDTVKQAAENATRSSEQCSSAANYISNSLRRNWGRMSL